MYYTTNDIQTLIDEGKYNEASDAFIETIKSMQKENSSLLGKTYYDYALFLFNLCEYELSILMFQSSYNLDYRKDDIIEFIYASFILPNQDEFINSYKVNTSNFKDKILFSQIPDCNELPIDFIPVTENKYFIFDKQLKQFEGVIDLSKNQTQDFNNIDFNDEFSDLIIIDNWDIRNIHDYIMSANDRLIYYIAEDSLKLLSFLKLPNIIENYCSKLIWVQSIDYLQYYFHKNTAKYLPRIVVTNKQNNCEQALKEMIEKEHNYRLTPEGRNTSDVILTIGIPSYNRGNRALKNIQNLMKLPYDAEIEFVVSNNCSTKNTEGYDEIEDIADSRITYFKFPDKPGQNINFCQPIYIAKGRFICLLSDEDNIILASIQHYLSILRNNPNISFAKSKGANYYNDNTGEIYAKGKDAFLKSFLGTNYISGLIFRTDLFHSLNIYSWIADQIQTNYAVRAYSHSCFSALYSLHGDYLEDNTLLFVEGDAEKDSNITKINSSTTEKILTYATVESRIEQHNGFIDILNQLSINLDKETYIEGYKTLCRKTFLLMNLVKKQYLKINANWIEIMTDISNCCVDGILKLNKSLTKEEKNVLVYYIYTYFIYFTEEKILQ